MVLSTRKNVFELLIALGVHAKNFVFELNKAYEQCFPLKTKYVSLKRLCKSWISSGILKSIKIKSQYFKLYELGITRETTNRNYRNRLNSVIRQAKRNYYIKALNESRGNLKKTWKLIRELLSQTRRTSCIIRSVVTEGGAVEEAGEIYDCFSQYFAGEVSNLDASIPLTDVSPLSSE